MSGIQMAVRDRVERFLGGGPKLSLIGGKWIHARARDTLDIVNPATGRVTATVAACGGEEVEDAVAAATAAFHDPAWAAITPHQRAKHLLDIADQFAAHSDELGLIQSIEMGVVFKETRLVGAMMADCFPILCRLVHQDVRPYQSLRSGAVQFQRPRAARRGRRDHSVERPNPRGLLEDRAALACGNTLVMKPGETAPLAVIRIAELIDATALPKGVFNLVVGLGKTVGEALATHPGIAKVGFTGSTATGQHLMEAGAKTMKKVTLELGGKSPTVIFADADLAKAVPVAIYNFTGSTGQMCTAGTRVLVEDSIFDEVVEAVVAGCEKIKIGSPLDAATDMGPLASKMQRDKVADYLKVGAAEGARQLTGGMIDGDGFWARPTVFVDVEPEMRVWREEIFGPVAVFRRFSDEADAVAQANDTQFGLAAGLWTRTSAAPTGCRAASRPARCGSTMRSSSTRSRRSAATSCRAPAANWDRSRSTPTPR